MFDTFGEFDSAEEINKAAGVDASVKMGIPGMGRAYEIIKAYYLGGAK